jgi:type VI protein secretion system component VasF
VVAAIQAVAPTASTVNSTSELRHRGSPNLSSGAGQIRKVQRDMSSQRTGPSWMHERRAEYNRWADRHTWLIAAVVTFLFACLIIVIAARLSHEQVPLPGESNSPQMGQGRLP